MCICVPGSLLEPLEVREGIRRPRTGVTDGCEPPCGSWELNSENPAYSISPTLSSKTAFLCSLFRHYSRPVVLSSVPQSIPKLFSFNQQCSLTSQTQPSANRLPLSLSYLYYNSAATPIRAVHPPAVNGKSLLLFCGLASPLPCLCITRYSPLVNF